MKSHRRSTPVPSANSAPAASQAKKRRLVRVKPLNAHEVLVRLVAPGCESAEPSLEDLSMSGAGVSFRFEFDPGFRVGDMVEVHLEHAGDGWIVDTPARVAHTRQSSDLHVLYGLEFVNAGNLYGQMDDAWAHYFSRREEMRFGIDLDAPMNTRLRQQHHRMDASVTDISSTCLGVRAAHHMACVFKMGEPARLFFDAEDSSGEFEVAVTLINATTLGEWDYIHVKINEEQPDQGATARGVLLEYVEQRRRELEAREDELRD